MVDHSVATLSRAFERFAKEECYNSSPLYERLSLAIANDPELLSLVAHARKGERVPNLLFAAVHFLLLKGINHPVVRFYESLSGIPETRDDPYSDFRSFCLAHQAEIAKLVSSRALPGHRQSGSCVMGRH